MKKVLITGANSYIGTSFENWVKENNSDIIVDTVDMIGDTWKEKDFRGYDAVFHVAGIVHQKQGAVSDETYYKVNCDLVIEVAAKAKRAGVHQFVFLSTMSVYGMLIGYIDEKTEECPINAYGKSKLKAEKELQQLATEKFLVAILRPPMIYGKNCKGNFTRLAKFANMTPIFPKFENRRSMLYIENLNLFVAQIIEKEKSGMMFPQDGKLVSTWEIVSLLCKEKNKKMIGVKLFNPIIRMLQKKIGTFQKVWGDLSYTQDMSIIDSVEYQKYSIEEAIHEIMN